MKHSSGTISSIFFEDRGFEVFAVENAESAIEALAENPWIPILLTDIQMPGSMNGIELAHHVRDRYPPMVIVVASGTLTPAAEELPERALFVSKPFDPHHVLREMRRLGA